MSDVVSVFPQLAPLARRTVLLRPRRVMLPLPAQASKIGGRILWPVDEPWPTCQEPEEIVTSVGVLPEERLATWDQFWSRRPRRVGIPYHSAWADADDPLHNDHFVTVLQLRRADVPLLPFPPGTDLFQVIWCPRLHMGSREYEDDSQPLIHVYWRSERSIGRIRDSFPAPVQPDRYLVPHECALAPEAVWDYPSLIEIGDQDETLGQAVEEWYFARVHGQHRPWQPTRLARGGTKAAIRIGRSIPAH